MSANFQLRSNFKPRGDQPGAIQTLVDGFSHPSARQVLLGVTGSGKTFTVANVIQELQVPTLVIAPNKTLAGQLYTEFCELFPENAVEFFVSYYDYYQPEAYLPSSDTYIEKDARINEKIDRMRNSATVSLLHRKDVIVVASVSSIYGLGDPENYRSLALNLQVGEELSREELLRGLVRTQHRRVEQDFRPGSFRVRGNCVEIWPIQEEDNLLSVELNQNRIESLLFCDSLSGEILSHTESVNIFPVGHYVQPEEKLPRALQTIRKECEERVRELLLKGKGLEAERLQRRVFADLDEMEELGICHGIENYARHLEGRVPGQPPFTLLNYFPQDFLCVMDESHVSLPQLYGMVRGDSSRKKNLIEHGFRLPSALDNRPLGEPELEGLLRRVLYVSATPTDREKGLANHKIAEQIVRPTGLLEPLCEIRSATGQVEDALHQCRLEVKKENRVLVTTLTKRSAEDLTEFLQESGLKARYLHSDIDTLERAALLRDLRIGVYDILVGINLLREGLDLPEVSLVLVLDADREGFLRSETSLTQTCGRAARHLDGRVIFYADKETKSIKNTIKEAKRRRKIQEEHNRIHGITPASVNKKIAALFGEKDSQVDSLDEIQDFSALAEKKKSIQKEMLAAAGDLDFENAIHLRDELRRLEALELDLRG
ncbi:MAG: excinuclease ABC subunit UvrB [Planctomycetota bacterium]|jgi:excinuclease ABC subunit B|nr:excinuclease ABC subunit UvrB [Planctomycetota bacterium]MDP6940600.1 excinuclease ABC subunit UvrB [Planctomycetota bacterium]